MEKISIDGRVIPTLNGGHGSGNFGHSGRPGKVGGSGKGNASGKDTIDIIHDDPRGKYSDGFDTMEKAKEYLVDHIGEGGVGDDISMVYEDNIRDMLSLPSKEEEQKGGSISMADLSNVQGEMGELIRSKSFDELKGDLGQDAIGDALDCALKQGGIEYALQKAERAKGHKFTEDAINPKETAKKLEREVKDFMADFGLSDHYGIIEDVRTGRTYSAWKNLTYELADKIDDEHGKQFGRDFLQDRQ